MARTPKYRKQVGEHGARAFVQLGATRHYLGAYGSPESRTEYARRLAEWEASGRQSAVKTEALTIEGLEARFWTWAQGYFAGGNRHTTSELETYKAALRPLDELYADTPAAEFGPKRLKVVREAMIKLGWSRGYTNKQVGRIKRVFKWGVSEELVPAGIFHGLQAVSGLRIGRTDAVESPPVEPVADELVDAVLPFLSDTVRAMVEVQRLSGMRSCEVCLLRADRLDMSDESVWVFTPETHKNAWRGRQRKIHLGPRAATRRPPVPRDEWPLWAKTIARLATSEDSGVGDTITRTIGPVGCDDYKKWFKALTGHPCGCNARQERFNLLYEYE